MSASTTGRQRVVVIGAGFGGLRLTRELREDPCDVIIVDQHNYHLFQPLLYQVATAALEPADIAYAVRGIIRRCPNVEFRTAQIESADFENQEIVAADGERIRYDQLVLAAGAVTATFGVTGVAEHAFELKGLDQALSLRTHLLQQFEACHTDPSLLDEGLLTFVVVGGGPTGIELAGALSELVAKVLSRDFPRLDLGRTRVVLVEMLDHVLSPFDPDMRDYARHQLARRGVELRLGRSVSEVRADEVILDDGTTIRTKTCVWAAGVRATPLADVLGLEQTAGGRIVVNDDLSVPEHDNIWVIGDLAGSRDGDGQLHPQLAPVAIQGAKHVAAQLRCRREARPTSPFRYVDKGAMATVGRRAAVAQIPPGIKVSGTVAWLLWLFLHVVTLIGFRNRLSVLLNWAWNYLTWDRAARIILDLPIRRGLGGSGRDVSNT